MQTSKEQEPPTIIGLPTVAENHHAVKTCNEHSRNARYNLDSNESNEVKFARVDKSHVLNTFTHTDEDQQIEAVYETP